RSTSTASSWPRASPHGRAGAVVVGVMGSAYVARLTRERAARPRALRGDDLRRARAGVGPHLVGDAVGLFDERLDDLGLGHRLDDLALHEDLALAVAARDTEVGVARLAGPVHDAAHDRDAQRHRHVLEALRDALGERVHVDLRAAARRARDDLERALAQVERLQDLVADLDLLGRRRRERDADRDAD